MLENLEVRMLRYTAAISAFVGSLLAPPVGLLDSAPLSPLWVFLPLQPASASPFPDYTSPVPVQAPPPVLKSERKPEAAASSSEEGVVTATALVTARLAEVEAEIARTTRDVAALTSVHRDLQERIDALSGQTLETNQRLNKLRGSVPNTEDETPGLVPVDRYSTEIGQVKVGG
jgi:hypothetical protein